MVAAIKKTVAYPSPAGPHALLKQRTFDLHRKLDSSPCLLALMRPGLGLVSYAGILRRLALAYARIEPLLHELQACRPAGLQAYEPRLPALLVDLACLPEVGPLPEAPPLEPPMAGSDTAYYLGVRYVVEGSTQGARLIYSQLERNLPQLACASLSYWHIQHEAAAGWPLFRDCLNRTELHAESLVQGAEAAFSVFIDVFASPVPDA